MSLIYYPNLPIKKIKIFELDFMWFDAISRLKVNLKKSELIPNLLEE